MSYLTMPVSRLGMPRKLMMLAYGGRNMNAYSWFTAGISLCLAQHREEDNACIFDNVVCVQAVCPDNFGYNDADSIRQVMEAGRVSVYYGHIQSPVMLTLGFFVCNMREFDRTRQHARTVIVPCCHALQLD